MSHPFPVLFCPDVHKEKMPSGSELTFYPVSLRTAFLLRSVIGPIAEAVAVLLSGKDLHTTVRSERTEESQVCLTPPSPELLNAVASMRSNAINKAILSITDPKNVTVIGQILMDSLRDLFPKGATANPTPEAFMDTLELPMLTTLLIGVFKANKGVFGPLTPTLGAALQSAEGSLRSKVEGMYPTPMTSSTTGGN